MLFVRCCTEAKYERALWILIRSYSLLDVAEVSPCLVMLHFMFHRFYLIDRLENWMSEVALEFRLRTHHRQLLVG